MRGCRARPADTRKPAPERGPRKESEKSLRLAGEGRAPAPATSRRRAAPALGFRLNLVRYCRTHQRRNGADSYRVADTLTRAERSERLSRVRGKDSKPEMVVRRLIHGMGYRYRLHRRDLPGTPDLVFPSRKKAIHLYMAAFGIGRPDPACNLARMPKSRLDFWKHQDGRAIDSGTWRTKRDRAIWAGTFLLYRNARVDIRNK